MHVSHKSTIICPIDWFSRHRMLRYSFSLFDQIYCYTISQFMYIQVCVARAFMANNPKETNVNLTMTIQSFMGFFCYRKQWMYTAAAAYYTLQYLRFQFCASTSADSCSPKFPVQYLLKCANKFVGYSQFWFKKFWLDFIVKLGRRIHKQNKMGPRQTNRKCPKTVN